MIYIPIHKSKAEELSRALYLLTVPNPTSSHKSINYCDILRHDSKDIYLLAFIENDEIPINKNANIDLILDCLSPFVASGDILQSEVEHIEAHLNENRGGKINPSNLVPATWQQYIMNYDQAMQEGYYHVN